MKNRDSLEFSTIRTTIMLILIGLGITSGAYAESVVEWNSSTHTEYYLDFNDDGISDLFLHAKRTSGHNSMIVKGVQRNFETHYFTENALPLAPTLFGESWFQEDTLAVTGFFNGDSYEDVLIVNPASRSRFIIAGNSSKQFRLNSVSGEPWEWLTSVQQNQLLSGDFNNDKTSDILVLFNQTGTHMLYHGEENGTFSLAQQLSNAQLWGVNGEHEIRLVDINEDGFDDILALSRKREKSHYFIYTDNAGLLNEQSIEVIQGQFASQTAAAQKTARSVTTMSSNVKSESAQANQSTVSNQSQPTDQTYVWLADGYSTAIVKGGTGVELVRLYNENGGINEEGRFIPNMDDPLLNKPCKNVVFNVADKTTEVRCNLESEEDLNPEPLVALNNLMTADFSVAASSEPTNNKLTAAEKLENWFPTEMTQEPSSSVGAYPAVGQSFTLSWPKAAKATTYEIWVSRDYGKTIQNSYLSTSQPSHTNTVYFNLSEDSIGSRFYYVRACNSYGCSGLSPYKSVFIYGNPEGVKRLNAAVDNVTSGSTINLSWERPFGVIGSGGYYIISQRFGNSGEYQELTRVFNGWITSASVNVGTFQGEYNYKIAACNKTDAYCSELSAYIARVKVVATPPNNAPQIKRLKYTPVDTSIGLVQKFSFDYVNASRCSTSGTKKNGQLVLVNGKEPSVVYLDNSTVGSGTKNLETFRQEAVSYEFDVTCYNNQYPYDANNPIPSTLPEAATKTVFTYVHPNRAPIAYTDSITIAAGAEPIVIDVLDNDYDADLAIYDNPDVNHAASQKLEISGYSALSGLGNVICDDEQCIYTPPNAINSNSQASFNYSITDKWGGSSSAMVTINIVSAVGDPAPIIGGWDYADGANTIRVAPGYYPQNVSINDHQGFGFTYSNVRECYAYIIGANGEEQKTGIVYVEDRNSLQSGSFYWDEIRKQPAEWDFFVKCTNNSAAVNFKANASIIENKVPIANADQFALPKDVSSNLHLLNNDTDEDNHSLSIDKVSVPINGAVEISNDGKYVTYTPNSNYSGSDSFSYTISDGFGGESSALVTVYVAAPISQPSITPDSGNYANSVNVRMRSNVPAGVVVSMHYTVDGSAPDATSPVYSGAFYLTSDTTVKAIALASQRPDSPITEKNYTITVENVIEKVVAPAAGNLVVTVQASDDVGVDKVMFRLDSGQWFEDTNGEPWQYDFGKVIAGNYVIYTKAVDTDGQESALVATDITVDGSFAISNTLITPVNPKVGQSQSLYFEYSQVTKCYETANQLNVFYEGPLATGSYSGELPAKYRAGQASFSLTCINDSKGTLVESYQYIINSLAAPTGLKEQQ